MVTTKSDWLAYTAIAGNQIAFMYELILIIKNKDAEKFSWAFVLLSVTTSILGFIFGIKNKIKPLIITGIIDIIISILFIIFKFMYFKNNCEKIKFNLPNNYKCSNDSQCNFNSNCFYCDKKNKKCILK